MTIPQQTMGMRIQPWRSQEPSKGDAQEATPRPGFGDRYEEGTLEGDALEAAPKSGFRDLN